MSATFTVGLLLLLSLVGYVMGRSRAVTVAGGSIATLHSVPNYYGSYVALWAGLPALVLMLFWMALRGPVMDWLVLDGLSQQQIQGWAQVMLPPNDLQNLLSNIADETAALTETHRQLLLINIKNLAGGQALYVNPAVVESIQPAADHLRNLRNLSDWTLFGAVAAISGGALAFCWARISPTFRARNNVERVVTWLLILCSTIAVFTTIGIVLSLLFESIRFFTKVPLTEFLFGLHWSPQTAIRADQVGSSGSFGAIPLFTGTLLIAFIAMVVAAPVGLMSAIYLSEYAPRRVRSLVKPVLEILAGVPTVVYGFFAILTVAPFIRDLGAVFGIPISSQSALAAGVVMGVMIVPFVSSLADDVINAVPQSLRDGSLGLGATKSETIKQVVIPAALPGIVGALLLAVSRAIGETMIVVMAAGLQAYLTLNPLESVTTVTVQIKSILVGDQEFDSAKTLSVFALGLMLFIVTLVLNVVALRIVQKYREKYD
ncbi:phosphate ABC transporter permease subunit PstC [Niveispirillum sp. SYP-B3756]|uniref:phosphate ABC transporter permease subunit PstC n=1 Tax=Niveispirillum sp. SYP-B3756 TaxID=2662178 RepID=UPI001292A5A0|nr:phosphate ABC transporter permease subunit PstC [Niveispirillum sp. SYP-B3756]MQP67666.1 phosphate ABC transporter permease subunit PstC [Niveispirillum sp. SYP-B3756]